ncbi:hypothetical protein BT69DRAFT_6257 [Atractiella rhizophila]|nr:hypothetical protein BT69DRAFT_6257 [Atractiella rhizophila]
MSEGMGCRRQTFRVQSELGPGNSISFVLRCRQRNAGLDVRAGRRLEEHVKQFNVWRELWKDQPPLNLDGSPADATDLEWLRHTPRLILSQPNLSTRKILSKNALWNGGDVSEVMETDLIPVLTYHSTVS